MGEGEIEKASITIRFLWTLKRESSPRGAAPQYCCARIGIIGGRRFRSRTDNNKKNEYGDAVTLASAFEME